jgi:hypothetical protein
MKLTNEQKQEIIGRGYTKIPGVVPQDKVDAALRAINGSFGEGIDPEQLVTYRSRSFCPELQGDPVITGLLNETPAWSLAESAIGKGRIKPATRGQLAIRFPVVGNPELRLGGHLDGRHSPTNGVPKDDIRNFTMLVGVALSDVTTEWSGNLALWPGTHVLYEAYFREHGCEILRKGGKEGMPPIDEPEAEQQMAKAGDVFFVHYQIKHGSATNVGPYPRYAIYFRLNHVDHDRQRFEALTDIWMEWEGIDPRKCQVTSDR